MTEQLTLTTVLTQWSEEFMHHSFRDFKRFMDEWGLSASQVNTLMRLYHSGVCGVTHISRDLGVSNAASSQLVDRLVQQGLIERSEAPDDRRVKQIQLTSAGRALIEAGIKARVQWIEGLTDELTPEQQTSIAAALILLTDAMRKIEHNLERQPRPAPSTDHRKETTH